MTLQHVLERDYSILLAIETTKVADSLCSASPLLAASAPGFPNSGAPLSSSKPTGVIALSMATLATPNIEYEYKEGMLNTHQRPNVLALSRYDAVAHKDNVPTRNSSRTQLVLAVQRSI